MPGPQISVALPVFNGAQFIELALRSILAQAEDCEIVVSDDCSTDNTTEIVRSLQAPQIKLLINERNGGQFVNFNRALRIASGRYIQLFSHDDVAQPGFLRSQIDALERNPYVGLAYASCNIIDSRGRFKALCDDDGTPEIVDFRTYLYISSRHGSLPASVSSVMLKREVLDSVGLFDEQFRVAGDLEFYNRVAEKFLFVRNRTQLLDVRVHGGSVTLSSMGSINYMQEEIEILRFYRRHLGEAGYKEMINRRVCTRGADHGKYIIRSCLRGELKKCVSAYRALSQVHNVPLCLALAVLQGSARILGRKEGRG